MPPPNARVSIPTGSVADVVTVPAPVTVPRSLSVAEESVPHIAGALRGRPQSPVFFLFGLFVVFNLFLFCLFNFCLYEYCKLMFVFLSWLSGAGVPSRRYFYSILKSPSNPGSMPVEPVALEVRKSPRTTVQRLRFTGMSNAATRAMCVPSLW